MYALYIEQDGNPDYDAWRAVFDKDPLGREQSGVRYYKISRSVDEPDHVIGELEFETRQEAEAFADRLHELWSDPQLPATNGQVRVVEIVEGRELGARSTRRAA